MHDAKQTPEQHNRAPPEHRIPHVPQFCALVFRFISQPFVTIPSQSAKPVVHIDVQTPAVHSRTVFGRAAHEVAHVPQWSTSVERFASQPSVGTPLQSEKPLVQA